MGEQAAGLDWIFSNTTPLYGLRSEHRIKRCNGPHDGSQAEERLDVDIVRWDQIDDMVKGFRLTARIVHAWIIVNSDDDVKFGMGTCWSAELGNGRQAAF